MAQYKPLSVALIFIKVNIIAPHKQNVNQDQALNLLFIPPHLKKVIHSQALLMIRPLSFEKAPQKIEHGDLKTTAIGITDLPEFAPLFINPEILSQLN